jgi:glycosyltransferase involved in cell wall biosynthesis
MKHSVYKLERFVLLILEDEKQTASAWPTPVEASVEITKPASFFKKLSSGFLLVTDSTRDVSVDAYALRRLLCIARDTGAGIVYSDFFDRTQDTVGTHPLNDYQAGSIRDDFNFGPLFLISAAAVETAIKKYGAPPNDDVTVLYDLRLKISIDHDVIHIPEFLYTATARKQNPVKKPTVKTEAHFAYVAKENFTLQQKMEKIATTYLKRIGAHLPARTAITAQAEDFQWKASIVIPVLNRKQTIACALKSALEQRTDFPFNILVVDNHSTDGTTNILKMFAAKYPHLHHIIPSRRDLAIGGCWNEAIASPACGRYVVQLDSDDLYSTPQTLQKIVNTLRKGQYAMVVGSYTLVNEKLRPILPGLIDHREWTQQNGHNNLLRINGMGAPRAFDTTVIRQIGFPNVSYGEDYAVALRLTREYKIGRIYESLYLCRRWSDNTDAGLSVEKQNRNDFYKDRLRTLEIKARQLSIRQAILSEQGVANDCSPDTQEESPDNRIFAEYPGKRKITLPALCDAFFKSQKKTWPALALACRDLAGTQVRELSCGKYKVTLQYNPARALSGGAAVDPESIRRRPCFLCSANRPSDQQALLYRNEYLILCNPAPIFNYHFTVVSLPHRPQEITLSLDALMQIAFDATSDYTVFYNGPACGASAPDHLHFQMIPSASLPFLKAMTKVEPLNTASAVRISSGKGFDRAAVVMESKNAAALSEQFFRLIKASKKVLTTDDEPPVNVFCDYEKGSWRLTIFLRQKHRPDAYYAEGENRIFVSPGAIDMAGVVIMPQLHDYQRLDYKTMQSIYREVSLNEKTRDDILASLQAG